MEQKPDEYLMEEIKNGDDKAFSEIMARYKKSIANFAYRMLGDENTAKDIAAEVFMRIYIKAKDYQPQAKFTTWMYKIARNLCIDELKRRSRVSLFPFGTRIEENGEIKKDLIKATIDQRSILEKRDIGQIVKRAVIKLPKALKEVIIMREYQGLSYDEISRILDTPLNTVKSLIHRARLELKNSLGEIIF